MRRHPYVHPVLPTGPVPVDGTDNERPYAANTDRLPEYCTALISAAVTGKIDVRGEVEL
jgi:hypothetical protein